MPPEYRIDRGNRRVLSVVRGAYSYDVAVGRLRRLQADPKFDPAFALLIDFREATAIEISHDEVVELSNFRLFAADSKRA